ncbi:hypothetical protein McpAg1_05380 [Methanocorpusculaceae archaeon Ag1]|uniref:Uncharacterized protein n=1 Tax=Methanorbis furvi TaxID=3028299 RepID=A0AAE4MA56_9EURY|nr:hypothetical protein [Methanocorpusculaceae archaeon Ag1]
MVVWGVGLGFDPMSCAGTSDVMIYQYLGCDGPPCDHNALGTFEDLRYLSVGGREVLGGFGVACQLLDEDRVVTGGGG